MNDNPYESPHESEVDVDARISLAHQEHLREVRLEVSRRRLQLWRVSAWLIVAGVAGCFVHLLLFHFQFNQMTMIVDAASAVLIGGGLLLGILTPLVAGRF